jgi:hypothetical protein
MHLFCESITRLLAPGGRFIGYNNPWFIENRIKPAFERESKLEEELKQ